MEKSYHHHILMYISIYTPDLLQVLTLSLPLSNYFFLLKHIVNIKKIFKFVVFITSTDLQNSRTDLSYVQPTSLTYRKG